MHRNKNIILIVISILALATLSAAGFVVYGTYPPVISKVWTLQGATASTGTATSTRTATSTGTATSTPVYKYIYLPLVLLYLTNP